MPHLAGLRLEQVFSKGLSVRIEATAKTDKAVCPDCGVPSARVHSRYQRRLSDAAVGGRELLIHLRVRRFFCDSSCCARKTFAEQVPGVTVAHARRTPLPRAMLERIALALGGRPGERMARHLAVSVSRMSLLRLIRALPIPAPGVVAVLGVDDFATRRGHTYGTILVDMDSRQPIDVLPDRLAETFTEWLRAHPGAEVICRDRGGSYAEGARLGAPNAIQVADRFHLLYNLTDAVDRVVRAHRKCLVEQPAADAVAQPPPSTQLASPDVVEGPRAQLTRQRWTEVHALWDKGIGTTAIGRALNLDHKTVLRYARAAKADDLLTAMPRRGGELDAHAAYLAQRWQEGCTNAAHLTSELRERGYRGSTRTVRRLLHTWRASATPPSATPITAPKPRAVTGWIIRPAVERSESEQADLTRILDRCSALRTVEQLVSDFGGMLRQRQGQHLDTWIAKAQATDIAPPRGFAAGLLKDYDAVRNGLTLSWSSGAVEGTVTKIKALKRAMYGRANFDLLRRRILLGT